MDVLFILVFFQALFSTADFPIHSVQGGIQNGVWMELHISK